MPEPEQRFSEQTPERELLMAIYDRLGLLINVEVKTSGNDTLRLDQWPRPQSALARVQAQRFLERHDSLVRRLTPQ